MQLSMVGVCIGELVGVGLLFDGNVGHLNA